MFNPIFRVLAQMIAVIAYFPMSYPKDLRLFQAGQLSIFCFLISDSVPAYLVELSERQKFGGCSNFSSCFLTRNRLCAVSRQDQYLHCIPTCSRPHLPSKCIFYNLIKIRSSPAKGTVHIHFNMSVPPPDFIFICLVSGKKLKPSARNVTKRGELSPVLLIKYHDRQSLCQFCHHHLWRGQLWSGLPNRDIHLNLFKLAFAF